MLSRYYEGRDVNSPPINFIMMTQKICTGHENHGTKELNLMAYIAIVEYLANVGGGAGMSTYLNEIFHSLVELENRS